MNYLTNLTYTFNPSISHEGGGNNRYKIFKNHMAVAEKITAFEERIQRRDRLRIHMTGNGVDRHSTKLL